jgi:phosphatidylinositol alpha-mannosyltransferase
MKILQLCPYAMDRPGGVQRNVRDLAAWLSAQGHETRILAPPAPGQRPRRRGNLIELGRARRILAHGTEFELSLALPWTIAKAAREARAWGADLLHLHTPWTPALVGQLARALPLPQVTTIHATLPDQGATGLVDRYIAWSGKRHLARAAAVIVPSTSPVAGLQAWQPELEITVLPPTVDLSGFAPGEKEPLSCLFLGRLEPRKGLDILLEAWPRVQSQLAGASLTVAGDGEMRARVEGRSDLRYVGRPSDAELRALLATHQLFIAPAPFGESYGLVLAEAAASGALPIAAANGGYRRVLADLPELLVPPRDAAALAAKIVEVARSDPSRYAARLAQVVRNTDVAHMGPRYLALFEETLAKRRSQA